MARPHARWLGLLMLLVGVALFVLLPAAAGAQENDYPVTTVPTTTPVCFSARSVEVCGTSVTEPRSSSVESLPFTGGDVAMLTVLGLAAAAAGAGLVWFGRRSDSAA
jgi:hypothetical protein